MKRALQAVIAAGALALGAGPANATAITWNFGTSGYSLSTGPTVSPPAPPSFTATSGPFAPTASGNTAAITAISPVYQDALFTSGGFTVGAYAWGNGGNTQDKVTQSNNYATTINSASVHITGLGACSSLCSGFSTTLGDTEWLTLALGSHPGWSLQSIVFGDVMNSPGEQVEFWFSNDATRSAALSGTKYDDTILQMGANVCVGGIGVNGSCLFDFSALGVDPDNYPYLWATAVNPNSDTANQPAILITQLTADPVPEPSTLSVLGISLLIFGVAWRRREAA
jgi:PEP-CTERM motif